MENIYMKILKNIIITAAMLAAATAICFILRPLVPTDTHVPVSYTHRDVYKRQWLFRYVSGDPPMG